MQDPNTLSPDELKAKKHRRDIDLVSLQSDWKKGERLREEILIEFRQLKRKRQQLDELIHEREERIKTLDKDQYFLESEIKRVKRELNMLH